MKVRWLAAVWCLWMSAALAAEDRMPDDWYPVFDPETLMMVPEGEIPPIRFEHPDYENISGHSAKSFRGRYLFRFSAAGGVFSDVSYGSILPYGKGYVIIADQYGRSANVHLRGIIAHVSPEEMTLYAQIAFYDPAFGKTEGGLLDYELLSKDHTCLYHGKIKGVAEEKRRYWRFEIPACYNRTAKDNQKFRSDLKVEERYPGSNQFIFWLFDRLKVNDPYRVSCIIGVGGSKCPPEN